MSADLVAFIAYTVFAATDLSIQTTSLIGVENQTKALFCLRNPTLWLDSYPGYHDVEFSQTPLDLANIPPDILHLGQRLAQITGPLAVCYGCTVFLYASALGIIPYLDRPCSRITGTDSPLRPVPAMIWLPFGGAAHVSLVLIIFHCSLGDLPTSLFIWNKLGVEQSVCLDYLL